MAGVLLRHVKEPLVEQIVEQPAAIDRRAEALRSFKVQPSRAQHGHVEGAGAPVEHDDVAVEILRAQLRAEEMEGGADRLRDREGGREACVLEHREQRLCAAAREPCHRAARRHDGFAVGQIDLLGEPLGAAHLVEEAQRGLAMLGAAADMRLEVRKEHHGGALGRIARQQVFLLGDVADMEAVSGLVVQHAGRDAIVAAMDRHVHDLRVDGVGLCE